MVVIQVGWQADMAELLQAVYDLVKVSITKSDLGVHRLPPQQST